MTTTILRRAMLISLLIVVVPVSLLMLCSDAAIGRAVHSMDQADIESAAAPSPICASSHSSRLAIGLGEFRGKFHYGRRSGDADANAPAGSGHSLFVIRVDWIVSGKTIWSIEL